MGGASGDKRAKSDKAPRAEPNLELPSFRWGRGRKERRPDAEPSVPTAEPSALTPEPSVPTPEPSVPERKAPPPPPSRSAVNRPVPPPPGRRLPPAPPVAPPAPPVHDGEPIAALAPIVRTDPEPSIDRRPRKEPKAPRAPKAPRPPKESRAPRARKEPKPPREPKAPRMPKPTRKERRAARERNVVPLRWLPGYVAAIVTGGLIGGLTVLLAWATAQGCAAVRGVGTCGGYGIFALVAILGIDVIIATGVLRLCRVIDPATTAMLGVGLVALAAMVFFLGETQSFAMVYVIPTLMAVTFAIAWWITAAIARRVDE